MADETPELPEEQTAEASAGETIDTNADGSADETPNASDTSADPARAGAEATEDAGDDLTEEQKIKEELGIGAETQDAVSADQIDQMLGEAVDGFEPSLTGGLAGPAPGVLSAEATSEKTSNDPAVVDQNLQLLRDVNMKVKVELGRGHMYLKDILKLGQGSVVELERLAGDPLDIYVNEKVIARGEVLVLNENFCIRITEIYDHALA